MRNPNCKCTNCGADLYRRPSDQKRLNNAFCPNCITANKSNAAVQKAKQNYNLYIERWKNGLEKGWSGLTRDLSSHIRRYILNKYNFTCSVCGWNKKHPVDNLPLVEIDHIDGNAENCIEENLRAICPNCHSETLNFRARNKGNSTRIRQTLT